MRMDEEQMILLKDHFKEKFGGIPRCPLCGKNNWQGNPDIFQISLFTPGKMTIGGPLMPVVTIGCENCGSVQFFNAIATGIVVKEDREQSSPPDQVEDADNA